MRGELRVRYICLEFTARVYWRLRLLTISKMAQRACDKMRTVPIQTKLFQLFLSVPTVEGSLALCGESSVTLCMDVFASQ